MDGSLNKRVATLEKEVADLKASLRHETMQRDWQSTIGRFENSEHYDEATRLGRVWRKRQRKDGGSSAGPGHGSLERARSSERSRRKLAT